MASSLDHLEAPIWRDFHTTSPAQTRLRFFANHVDRDVAVGQSTGVSVTQFTVTPQPSILGDVNLDRLVNGLDVDPFVDVLLNGPFQAEADMNDDQVVNGLDVDPFVAAVLGGVQQIPEPSTLLLAFVALGVVGGRRKWKRAA